jgi:hypothetical protein
MERMSERIKGSNSRDGVCGDFAEVRKGIVSQFVVFFYYYYGSISMIYSQTSR